ncbi:Uncharacterized protein TCM_012298 [Theobroma cacao]|uniref:Uncharacterized protein n=1 Tax=Theobroma cacao TaxID=3641 RepID=A0A061FVS7_THECC|nr:Uncharacterized protein TCM_012298 [Theobroma cacao]
MMNNPGLSNNIDAADAEIEVANILLELSKVWVEPVVIRWRFRPRRSALKESPSLSHQSIPPPKAHYIVSSRLETPSCNGETKNEDLKLDTDQHVPYIEEKYSSENKVEPPDLEPTTPCNPQHKVVKIKFNPSSEIRYAQKHIQIEDKPPRLEADIHPEDVTIMKKTSNKRDKEEFEEGLSSRAVPKGCLVPGSGNIKAEPTTLPKAYNSFIPHAKPAKRKDKEEFEEGLSNLAVPKGHLVRGSGNIKAVPTTVPEANNSFMPHTKPAKRKQKEEMENEVAFWEQHKRQLLESIEKVKDCLEKRKALNLRLKALKLQCFSLCLLSFLLVKAKPDSSERWLEGDDFERIFRTDS